MQDVRKQSAPLITDTLPDWAPWALLFLGTFAASLAAILIRYAEGAHPLAISFWRCAAGAVVLAPFAWSKLREVTRSEARPAVIAGIFLAVHFATWIASVGMTSIASSVLLVSTAPIFIAIAARYLFREGLGRGAWWGIALAMAGTLVVTGLDFGGSSLDGNALALVGGATAGGYILAGRAARRSMGILAYAVIAYAVAALTLLVVLVPSGVALMGYDAGTWWAIVALIVGPQLLGHTLINLTLSDLDATTVSVTIMAEPIIAIIMAFVLFDEVPSWLIYPAGIAVLAGIYLVSTARREATPVLE